MSKKGAAKAVLKQIPKGVTRIKVTDTKGKNCWRPVAELRDSDTPMRKADGSLITMKGTPGRRSSAPLEAKDAEAQVARERKQQALASDPILQAAKKNPEGSAVLDYILVGLAEEASSIRFEREKAEAEGKETSAISNRRIRALKATAETYLHRRDQQTSGDIDLQSATFKKLFGFILETVRTSMADAKLSTETQDAVFAKLAKRLDDDWENEARNQMKGD